MHTQLDMPADKYLLGDLIENGIVGNHYSDYNLCKEIIYSNSCMQCYSVNIEVINVICEMDAHSIFTK